VAAFAARNEERAVREEGVGAIDSFNSLQKLLLRKAIKPTYAFASSLLAKLSLSSTVGISLEHWNSM
jgi:hypothetical protein